MNQVRCLSSCLLACNLSNNTSPVYIFALLKSGEETLSRSALFWDITQRRVAILYRRFGTTCRSHLQGSRSLGLWASWPLKMGPICCLETSVKDYHWTLRNIREERRSHQHRGRSLKSRKKRWITANVLIFRCAKAGLCRSQFSP
jgi:hypothetical protein